MKPRRLLALTHRYIGLGLMGLLFLAAFTGTLLVFGQELDRLLNPDILTATPPAKGTPHRPLTELVAAAMAFQQTRDDGPWQPLSLLPPRRGDGVGAVLFKAPDPEAPGRSRFHQVLVDPFTARILGERARSSHDLDRRNFVHLISEIHGKLLLGKTGFWIMGIASALWGAMTLLGLYLWWPGRGKVVTALKIKRQAGPARFHFDLHRALGFYSAPVALTLAVTGVYMALPGEVRPLVAALSPLDESRTPPPAPSDRAPVDVDEAVRIARTVFPDGELRRVGLPRDTTDSYAIGLHLPGEVQRPTTSRSTVWVTVRGGQVLRSLDATRSGPGDTYLNWQTPLHTGTAFGFPGRIAVLLGSLATLILLYAGLKMWLRRGSAQRPRRASCPGATCSG